MTSFDRVLQMLLYGNIVEVKGWLEGGGNLGNWRCRWDRLG